MKLISIKAEQKNVSFRKMDILRLNHEWSENFFYKELAFKWTIMLVLNIEKKLE